MIAGLPPTCSFLRRFVHVGDRRRDTLVDEDRLLRRYHRANARGTRGVG